MKIQYQFANETIEVEVDEKWGQIVLDFDHQEYNNNRAETRRHCSFDLYTSTGREPINAVDDFSLIESKEDIRTALKKLKPYHRRILEDYYFSGYTMQEIAEKEGVSKVAVKKALDRGIKKLKNFYKKG